MTQWLAARARNALRRPLRIIGVSATAFIAMLLTLILIPREATRTATQLLEGTSVRPDTVTLARRLDRLEIQFAAAESVWARHRARARLAARQTEGVARGRPIRPDVAAHRDSLIADRDALAALRARAARAPLPASFQALGDARALRDNPHVHALLDSLATLARTRRAIVEGRAGDPRFLALTARVTTVGRDLEVLAAAEDGALAAEIGALTMPAPPPTLVRADTVVPRMRVDSLHGVLRSTTTALDSARRIDAVLDARVESARAIANESAAPLALAAAALVLGVVLGFAVTFIGELATPRVSDGSEASRVTGVRTLATIVPRAPDPERARRRADRDVPPLIVLNSESYRSLYLAVSDAAAAEAFGFPLVAVTGDEAEVVGTVAANIAVAGVQDSRTALLIDADPDAAVVAGIVGVPRAPGVTDVLAGRADWASIIMAAAVGRDQSLSVMPAGAHRPITEESPVALPAREMAPGARSGFGDLTSAAHPLSREQQPTASVDAAALQAGLLRLGRRYDLMVVAAPAGATAVGPQSILPVHDAIICVRVAYTPLDRLAHAAATLHQSGLRVRGVVLWDADVPPRLTAP